MDKSDPFEVTIHGALRSSFEAWASSVDQELVSFGLNDAGVETFVLVIARGSASEARLIESSWTTELDSIRTRRTPPPGEY